MSQNVGLAQLFVKMKVVVRQSIEEIVHIGESELCPFRKLKCHTCGEISKMMVGMETKVAHHDAKIALTDTKLENMDTKLANIDVNEKLNKMKANIGTKMAQTDTKLEIINTKTANLQANVEARLIRVNNEGRNENEFK